MNRTTVSKGVHRAHSASQFASRDFGQTTSALLISPRLNRVSTARSACAVFPRPMSSARMPDLRSVNHATPLCWKGLSGLAGSGSNRRGAIRCSSLGRTPSEPVSPPTLYAGRFRGRCTRMVATWPRSTSLASTGSSARAIPAACLSCLTFRLPWHRSVPARQSVGPNSSRRTARLPRTRRWIVLPRHLCDAITSIMVVYRFRPGSGRAWPGLPARDFQDCPLRVGASSCAIHHTVRPRHTDQECPLDP